MPEVPTASGSTTSAAPGLRRELRAFHEQRFDEPLSDYHAEELLAFFLRRLGPAVYNQAIADARGYMLERLDDLDVEFHEPDEA